MMDPTSSLPKWVRWLGLAALIVALVLAFGIGAALAQERYSPSVRVDHARMFIEIESLRQQGKVDEAWAKYRQYGPSMANLAGAMAHTLPSSVVPVGDPIPMPQGQGNFRKEMPGFAAPAAFRFVVTEGPKGQGGYSSIFEYRGPPALRRCAVSTVPGDFAGASQGVQCTVFHNLPPGTYYFNVANVEPGAWPAMVETSWPR